MTTTQSQYLEEIKKRLKKASFGPWIVERTKKFSGDNWLIASCGNSYDGLDNFVTTDRQRGSETNFNADAQTDAEFIAHARTDIPGLLQINEKLTKALEANKLADFAWDKGPFPGKLPSCKCGRPLPPLYTLPECEKCIRDEALNFIPTKAGMSE